MGSLRPPARPRGAAARQQAASGYDGGVTGTVQAAVREVTSQSVGLGRAGPSTVNWPWKHGWGLIDLVPRGRRAQVERTFGNPRHQQRRVPPPPYTRRRSTAQQRIPPRPVYGRGWQGAARAPGSATARRPEDASSRAIHLRQNRRWSVGQAVLRHPRTACSSAEEPRGACAPRRACLP